MPHLQWEYTLELRRAHATDSEAVADLWLRSFDSALPTVRRAHTNDEVRAWFREVVIPGDGTWVASVDTRLTGVMVLTPGWIEQLYLDPDWRGRGLGDQFVELAKGRCPGGLQLWTFQVNQSACRFYERHRFAEAERTDGAGNEEREPDVRYVWTTCPGG